MDTIQFLYTIIGWPLGYILYFIYQFIPNVGIAILLFTFLIKLAMLPLAIKQQKNSAKSAIFAPKVREIQQKYKSDPQKQQEELTKLQQQGYNPYGGCGSMILTFLILFGVLDVVYKPMTHIVRVSEDKVSSIIQESYKVELAEVIVNELSIDEAELAEMKEERLEKHNTVVRDAEKILEYYNRNCLEDGETERDMTVFTTLSTDTKDIVFTVMKQSMLAEYAGNEKSVLFTDTDLYKLTDEENKEMSAIGDEVERAEYKQAHCFGDRTRELISTVQKHYGLFKVTDAETVTFQPTSALQRELYALECFGKGNNKDIYDPRIIGDSFKAELTELYDNLNFAGIPLGQVPWENMGFPIILVPIVSFLMALLQTFLSNRLMAQNNPEASSAMGGMKITMYIMPVFSLFLAFTIPAGAGFYWTISYVFGIIQTLILNKLYSPEKLRAQAEAEYAARMDAAKEQAKRIRDTDKDNSVHEYNGEQLTQKEINRRRLAEARRQDALKYGEEYKEDEDDD